MPVVDDSGGFLVDQIDQLTRSGWSMLVRAAEEVTDEHRAELVERIKASGVQPWAPGEPGHWLRLIRHAVTGRRIVPGRAAAGVRVGRIPLVSRFNVHNR